MYDGKRGWYSGEAPILYFENATIAGDTGVDGLLGLPVKRPSLARRSRAAAPTAPAAPAPAPAAPAPAPSTSTSTSSQHQRPGGGRRAGGHGGALRSEGIIFGVSRSWAARAASS